MLNLQSVKNEIERIENMEWRELTEEEVHVIEKWNKQLYCSNVRVCDNEKALAFLDEQDKKNWEYYAGFEYIGLSSWSIFQSNDGCDYTAVVRDDARVDEVFDIIKSGR